MKFGIGTYSFGGIASFLGLGPTLLEKFQTIKSLGFDTVELLAVDLARNSVEDIKKWLDETGLEVTSVHAEPTEEVVRKMAALDDMAEMAAPYGIKIGYHNHSSEFFFDEGKCLLEHLLDNSTKCFAQLDCGWAQNGGMYPPYFIRKYRDRIVSIHVKENNHVSGPGARPASRHGEGPQHPPMPDIASMPLEQKQQLLKDMEARFASMKRPVLQGKIGEPDSNMDWKEIKKALDEQSFEAFWIVEREDFYGDNHDQCLADDSAWLHANIQ